MIPKKPVPDLIRGGERFSEKIMREKAMIPKKPAPDLIGGGDRLSEKIMRYTKTSETAPQSTAISG
jgi:hypothetical protein